MKIKKFLKVISLESKGVRYRVIIAYSLAAVIPLLVATYLASTYIFPDTENMLRVSATLLITLAIAVFGFSLLREMVDSIIRMARQAHIISDGDNDMILEVKREDEIGQIATSINALVKKIKDAMAELGSYGAKAKRIDAEIHKDVIVMSELLNIVNLISAGKKLDEIFDFAIKKVVELNGITDSFLLMLDEEKGCFSIEAAEGPNALSVGSKSYPQHEGLMHMMSKKLEPLVFSSKEASDKELEAFKSDVKLINGILAPITAGNRLVGFLAAGNNYKSFEFIQEDLDIVDIFVKHLGVAVENELLAEHKSEYTATDDLTGVYNKSYILNRLDEELSRAIVYQRPCSFVMFDVDNFRAYREVCGCIAAEQALKDIASVLNECTTEVDKVARFEEDIFAIVLPEKNKRDAVKTAEDLRRRVESLDMHTEKQGNVFKLTISGGVSENPIDGADSRQLMEKAREFLSNAKSKGKNKIAS